MTSIPLFPKSSDEGIEKGLLLLLLPHLCCASSHHRCCRLCPPSLLPPASYHWTMRGWHERAEARQWWFCWFIFVEIITSSMVWIHSFVRNSNLVVFRKKTDPFQV